MHQIMGCSKGSSLVLSKIICIIALLSISQAANTQIGSLSLTCSQSGQSTAAFTTVPYSSYPSLIVEAEASATLPLEIFLLASVDNQSFFLFTSVLIGNNRSFVVIDSTTIPASSASKPLKIQCINSSTQSYQININLKGSNTIQLPTNPSCLFDCSSSLGNGGCTASNECQCSPGFFGYDCGVQGENIQTYLDSKDIASINFSGSKLFYLPPSSINFNDKAIKLSTLVIEHLKLFTYHGSQSSFLISNSYDLNTSSDIQIQELQFNSVSDSDYIFVIFQDLTSGSSTFIDIGFSVGTVETNESGFFSGRNVIGTVVLCLIGFFSLLIVGVIIYLLRLLYNYIHREKIALFKNQQVMIQIEQKMPSQTHAHLLQHFPNLSEIPECNICLEEFTPSDKVRLTHCFHVFHTQCLTEWMLSRRSLLCPLCRKLCSESDKEGNTQYKQKMRIEGNSPHEITSIETTPPKSEINSGSEQQNQPNQEGKSNPAIPTNEVDKIEEKTLLNVQESPDYPDSISKKLHLSDNKVTNDLQVICVSPRSETEQIQNSSKQPILKDSEQTKQPKNQLIQIKSQPPQDQQIEIEVLSIN